ncbi:hypothetical protein AB0I94_34565 [Streptomyces sp. NPDC050147]|uniref:hypothetical protein n=1 Tax=Streptomyces sp. NPDC050147 TaxID=3155513 RepID=UPI00342F5A9B
MQHSRALGPFEGLGDVHGAAEALGGLTPSSGSRGHCHESRRQHGMALATFRETRDRHGETRATTGLSLADWFVHGHDESAAHRRQVLTLLHKNGDRRTLAQELVDLGLIQWPAPYEGKRVIVVGGGNSAVQVGYELAEVATVTLATRTPVQLLPQVREGKDIHHWLTSTGFDHLPPEWLIHFAGDTLVMDTGTYESALTTGKLDRRPIFTALDGNAVVWSDGVREEVDVVLLATGYRPHLGYLKKLGALDADGAPLHSNGISTTHPGLVYLGLEFQRSFSSNTLRGVSRDAEYVIPPLAAYVRKAPAAAGF